MSQKKIFLIAFTLCTLLLIVSCNSTATNSSIATTTTPIPTPKPTPHPAALAALKSLRKIAGATEIGINVQDYGSRLIDTKADIDEQLAQLPEGEVKKEIQLALQAYVDAHSIWSASAEYDFVLVKAATADILKKYNIPTKQNADDKKYNIPPSANKHLALNLIWKAGDNHIEKATKLMNQ